MANSVEGSEGVEMLWLGRNTSPEMPSTAAESGALVQVALVEEKRDQEDAHEVGEEARRGFACWKGFTLPWSKNCGGGAVGLRRTISPAWSVIGVVALGKWRRGRGATYRRVPVGILWP